MAPSPASVRVSSATAPTATTTAAPCAASLRESASRLLLVSSELKAHERDRGDHARGDDAPERARERVPVAVGEHDRGRDAADADRAGQLGKQAAAAAPHVEPQLDRDERERDRDRSPERALRGEGRDCDERGEQAELDRRDPLGQNRAREAAVSPSIDEHVP